MRWVRLCLRVFGWLLTPFLAWAASFFGAVAGALIAAKIADPMRGVAVTVACGAVSGFAGILLWMRILRRSPEVREALAVTKDGVPDTVAFTTRVETDPEDDGAPTPRQANG